MTQTFTAAPRETLSYLAEYMVYKGWQPVWCLARQSGAFTPMPGTTGGSSPFGSVEPQPDGQHRLAFRPPEDVVVIDVDHYDHKRGMDAIDTAEERLGPLPQTWKVSSRGDENPSGRYLYRKPRDLDFSESALAAFSEDGTTRNLNIEIVRTAHRFSWAPGDINPKNGQVVMCWGPDGEPGQLPHVDELPELPEAWVNYLRNPPVPQGADSYTRPCDGPEWWLSQADDSLGTRTELAGFAMDLLNSRLPLAEALEQLHRVALDLNPADPWEDKHLLPLLDGNTQRKVAENLAHQDAQHQFDTLHEPWGEEGLEAHAKAARNQYEQDRALQKAASEGRLDALVEFYTQQNPAIPLVYDPEDPEYQLKPEINHENAEAFTRGLPEYTVEVKRQLCRKQAQKDVRDMLRKQFSGFTDITQQPEIREPERLVVTGKDHQYSAVIAPKTVSVFSGHRASGKTWVAAKFAAQELVADRHVIWIDFERQPALLLEKLHACGISNDEVIQQQLHYTSELPPDLGYIAAQYPDCLIVIDAWRGLQQEVAPTTSANDGDAVEQVYAEVLNPAVGVGATIIILDHMAKTGLGGTFGSERKESAADYVFKIEQMQAFSRKEEGYSAITVTKDRYGHHTADSIAAYLWIPAGESGPSIYDYPKTPELRNWSPRAEEVPSQEGFFNGEDKPAKAQAARPKTEETKRKELVIVGIVGKQPLQYALNALTREVMGQYPELFLTEDATKSFIRRMESRNVIIKDGGGKFESRQPPAGVNSPPAPVDLSLAEEADDA